MLRFTTKHENGFTLVEIMVALVIAAVLIAIAVPMFINQQKKSYDSSLKSDMSAAGLAVNAWASNNTWERLVSMAAEEGVSAPLQMSGTQWNQVAKSTAVTNNDLPVLSMDSGMTLTVTYGIETSRIAQGTKWDYSHGQGDFCLVGKHKDSNFNYPGGIPKKYNEHYYWDQAAGGKVFSMDELVQIKDSGSGTPLSCSGWVNIYMNAHANP